MLVYKVNNINDVGVSSASYTTNQPLDLSKSTKVDVTIEVFKKNAPLFTEYNKLLEACYKEQVYNDAVKATLANFTPSTPQSNQNSAGEENV